MLCRGNKKTVRMFDIAWKDYKVFSHWHCASVLNFYFVTLTILLYGWGDLFLRFAQAIDKPIKHNPGKDQNKVILAMRIAR